MLRPNSGISRRSLAVSLATTSRNTQTYHYSKPSLLVRTISSSTTTDGGNWMESLGIGSGTIMISLGALLYYYWNHDALMITDANTIHTNISDRPLLSNGSNICSCDYSQSSSSSLTNTSSSYPPSSIALECTVTVQNKLQQDDQRLNLAQQDTLVIAPKEMPQSPIPTPRLEILSTSSLSRSEEEDEDADVLQMSKAPRLQDKVAIITGASRGIGQAISIRFVQEGARVVLLDVADCNETLSIIRQIKGHNDSDAVAQDNDTAAMYIKCDISDEMQVQNAIRLAMERQRQQNGNGKPRIDVLVNNACCFVFENVEDATVDDWMKSMKVNILGHALVTKHCLPYMKHHAPTSSSTSPTNKTLLGSGPSIIFQGSISSLIGQPNCATYATMKGAILQMARNCAYDLAKYNIRVNTICAGTIETPISQIERNEHNWTYEQWSKLKTQTTLLQRVGNPMEVANVAVFLANSNESSYITGTHIMVDGGALSCGTVIGN